MPQDQINPSAERSPATGPAPTGHHQQRELRSLLASFATHHGRNLLPRKRRQLDELVDMLVEHFEDYGVETVIPGPGARFAKGAVSAGWLVERLDAFEDAELADALGGDRELVRFADTAIQALARWLPRAMS